MEYEPKGAALEMGSELLISVAAGVGLIVTLLEQKGSLSRAEVRAAIEQGRQILTEEQQISPVFWFLQALDEALTDEAVARFVHPAPKVQQ